MCAIRADLKLTLHDRGVTRLTGRVRSVAGLCAMIQRSGSALTFMIFGKLPKIKRPLDGKSEKGLRFYSRRMARNSTIDWIYKNFLSSQMRMPTCFQGTILTSGCCAAAAALRCHGANAKCRCCRCPLILMLSKPRIPLPLKVNGNL